MGEKGGRKRRGKKRGRKGREKEGEKGGRKSEKREGGEALLCESHESEVEIEREGR